MRLKRPGRSVTRMSPPGRKTRLHGLSRPSAIVTTRIFCVSVLNSRLWAVEIRTNPATTASKQINRLMGMCMNSTGIRAMISSQQKELSDVCCADEISSGSPSCDPRDRVLDYDGGTERRYSHQHASGRSGCGRSRQGWSGDQPWERRLHDL